MTPAKCSVSKRDQGQADVSRLFPDARPFPDRPWNRRGYGRIRITEPLASELYVTLNETIERRLDEMHTRRREGNEAEAESLKRRLRLLSTLRHFTHELIREQGWNDPP